MMRHLILSDVHSNWEALESVLKAAAGKFDRTLCCGDVVGYGPDPGRVTERIKSLHCQIVRGNHDKAVLGQTDISFFNPLARQAVYWTREVLAPEHWEFLREIPPGPANLTDFILVHGSLLDEDEYLFNDKEALDSLQLAWAPLVFLGHTHIQGGFALGEGKTLTSFRPFYPDGQLESELKLEAGVKYLINSGSVGQPRDRDPRAAYAIYDDEEKKISFCRAVYPIGVTQAKMEAVHLPDYLIQRLRLGR
jgi:predicted phosphodiesterase